MPRIKVNENWYELIYLIDSGSFGKVYLVRKVSNHFGLTAQERSDPEQYYILKHIVTYSQDETDYTLSEIATLEFFETKWGADSPFYKILDYEINNGEFSSRNEFKILMEYVNGYNIKRLMERGLLNEDVIKIIFAQLLAQFQMLHENNIVHRDVKLENILVEIDNESGEINVEIIDFGVACNRDQNYLYEYLENEPVIRVSQRCTKQRVGTPYTMAPEISALSHNKDKALGAGLKISDLKASDVWSLGILLFIMVHGINPFKSSTGHKISLEEALKIINHELRKRQTVYNSIIRDILVPVEIRPTIMELINKYGDFFSLRVSEIKVETDRHLSITSPVSVEPPTPISSPLLTYLHSSEGSPLAALASPLYDPETQQYLDTSEDEN